MKVTRRTGSLVIVLVIFAAIVLGTALAAIAIDKSEIPMLQQHAAEAAAVAAVGSDIGRDQTGSNIISINQSDNTEAARAFYYAIHPSNHNDSSTCNNVISLERDITFNSSVINGMNAPWDDSILSSGQAPSTIFYATGTFAGTIYGNGHTVTIVGPETANALHEKGESNPSFGGIAAKLSGKIYDLNVSISNRIQYSANQVGKQNISMGGLVGSLVGGTIDNCTVTYTNNVRFAAMSSSRSNNPKPTIGGLVGKFSSGTISNCTVNILNSDAWIESGIADGDGEIHTGYNYGYAGAVVGRYDTDGTKTLNNITVTGTGNIKSINSVSVLGAIEGGSVTVNNLYVSATIIFNNAGTQNALFTGTGGTINNYFYTSNAPKTNISWPSARAEVNTSSGYTIQFDPTIGDYSNSLAITFTNQSSLDTNEMYCVTSGSGEKFFSEIYEDGKVIFRNIKTSANTWKNSSNQFTATLSRITLEKLPALTEYEHGYVSEDYVSEAIEGGTAINNGTEFEKLFKPNGTADENGSYYLKEDIIITGFTGKTFSGTLDGNGKTIYIAGANTGMTGKPIGGLVGELTGKIKNVRVVIGNNVTVGTTATGGSGSYPMIGGIVGYLNGGTLENVQVVVPKDITFATQQFSSNSAFGGMVGEMNGATLTKVTAVIDGTLAPYGSYVWAAALVGKQKQNSNDSPSSPSTLTDVIVRGQGTFYATSSNSGGIHEDAFLAAVTVFQESSNVKRATVNGVIIDFTPKLNACDCYGIFTNNNYGGGNEADYSNVINASNIYVLKQAENRGNRGNKAIDESAVTKTIATTVQDRNDIPVTAYFPASENGNLVLVAGNGTVTVPNLQYANAANAAFNSTADGSYKVITVAKNSVTNNVSLNAVNVSNPTVPTGLVYSGQSGIEISIGTLTYGVQQLTSSDYTVAITANDSTGSVTNGKPVNAGAYTLTVTMANTNDFTFNDNNSPRVWSQTFNIARKTVELTGVTAVNRQYDGSTNVTVTGGSLSGVIGNDNVTFNLGTGTAVQANVGNGINVTVTATLSGTHAANYILQSQPDDVRVNITRKVLSFTAGTKSFPFANTTGTAITNQNITTATTYGLVIDGIVNNETPTYNWVITDTTTTPSSTTLRYVTDNTDAHTQYLAAGNYTVELSTTGNYTFAEDGDSFQFTVSQNNSANTWLTPYARADWTYYLTPSTETTPVPRFGTATVSHKDSFGNVYTGGFANTTPAGTYTAVVSASGNDSYNAIAETEYTFNVLKHSLNITDLKLSDTEGSFGETAATSYTFTYAEDLKLYATVSVTSAHNSDISGLLGTYSCSFQYSGEGTNGTAWDTTNYPKNAGIYTVTFNGITGGNYNSNNFALVYGDGETSAPSVSLTINAKPITVTASIPQNSVTYGMTAVQINDLITLTIAEGETLPSEVTMTKGDVTITYVGESGTTIDYQAPVDAGTTLTITVTISSNNGNYAPVQASQTLTTVIQKAKLTKPTAVAGNTYTYNGNEQIFAYESDIDASLITVSGNKQTNAGDYNVTFTINYPTNYAWVDEDEAVTQITLPFNIAKAKQEVTVTVGENWTYDGTAKAAIVSGLVDEAMPTITYSGKTYATSNNTYGPTNVAPTQAGEYTVKVSWTETTNYLAGEADPVKFTIERAAGFVNVKVNDEDYTGEVTSYYTGSAQTFKVTVEGHGGAIDINGTQSSTMNYYLTNVETKKVEVTVAETPNYNEATATTVEIEILPAVIQSVTLETTKFAFGTLNTENADDASTYVIAEVTFVNGDGSPEFIYSLAYNNTVPDNDVTYISAGTYTLTMKLTDEPPKNFKFVNDSDNITAEIEIVKVENNWISEDKIANYPFGFEGKPVTGTAKFGTAVVTYYSEGKAIEFDFDARAQDAGTYTAVVSVPANGNNYDEIFYKYTFVVQKHGLNITKLEISGTEDNKVSGSAADGFTVTYAPDMGLSATVSISYMEDYQGLLSDLLGDVTTRTYLFEYSADAEDPKAWTDGLPKDAGIYTVRFKGMKLAAGYNIDNFEFVSVPSVTLTIDPAKITVTAGIPENSVVYGMTAEEIRNKITLTPDEGVKLGEVTVTYDSGTKYDNTVAAGTKLTISVSVKAENKNYIAKFEGDNTSTVLTATVQQATLNVSAKDSSVLSANFNPDEFNEFKMYDAITAKWNGKIVTASDYFDVALTGYKGEVTGMTAEENFANREIGTYTFTASLKEKYQINFVTDPETIVYELTLGQSIVTLTVSIGNWTYGGTAAKPTFTVKASDGKEIYIPTIERFITVNYSNGSGYDSPDQPTDAGTYTLTANIVGHHDYVAENAATAKFTISPAEVKFVATLAEGAKLVYGIVPKDFNSLVTVTASGGINLGADGWGYTVTAAGDYTATTNAGTTVTLTVKFFVTDPNHTTVQPDKTLALEIQKAEQSVTIKISGWIYGGQAKEPDIGGIKENAVTTAFYSGKTNAGKEYSSTTAPTEAGTYTVTVSWEETDNYTAGKAEPVEFTVEKAKLTKPTENGNTFTYTGSAQTYTPDGFDPDTMTIAGNVQTNADTYTVTVSLTDNYNYAWSDGPDTVVEFTFVIGKAAQSVIVTISDWTYGDQAKEPDIGGIEESAATTAFYSGTTNAGKEYSSTTAPTEAGTYTVTVTWDETTNYTAGSAAPVPFTVEKAKLTKPTANDNTFTYTGAEQTYTPAGFDSATMTIAGNVQTNADTYTVTVSVTDKYNYVWADDTDTDITFTFVIGKAEQSVTVTIDGWTYGDTAKEYSVEGIMENAGYTVNYSGDGYSADTAPVNAGNYTLTITVDATANYNAAVASAEFAIDPKELHVSDSVMIIEVEYGELTLDDISSDEAIMAVIGDYTAIFDGLVYDDVLSADDFTLTAAEDYSDLVADGFMAVADYSIKVALNATLTNYVVPESGLENITFRVVKAANRIYGYSVPGWTYLDVRSEYIPAFSAAVFGTVVGSFFDENGTEIAVDDFGATTPAGTYTFRLSVAETDNYSGATRTGSFVVGKLIVVAELTATDVTYDGAVYDGISYTLSFDVSDYIGTVGYEYSENGSAFRKGLPTDAGNYSVRIGEYSDSDNIELRAETVDFQINPAPMHFTVTGVDGASIEYGTAIADIDVNALIVSVIPDSYVGGFEFTVSLITANGTAYRPGLYAGTVLYATVDITLDSNNYYPVVDTAIEMLPKVNITKVSHDMAFEVSDEIITDGSSAAVIEGSANTVIDAISYYMAINDIKYYEYHITVDGEEYSRDFVWAPGTHTVEVRLSGNHEGSTQFTVVIEEDPDAVDRAPFTPKTVVGEVLESINFTWASAVSIAFGVAVAVLIILFFGLRRAKRK